MEKNPESFNAALRNDFRSFVQRVCRDLNPGGEFDPGWHIDAMTWRLEQVAQGKIKRLIITIPPRHLKSTP